MRAARALSLCACLAACTATPPPVNALDGAIAPDRASAPDAATMGGDVAPVEEITATPPSFGAGFTDLTADIDTAPPFRLEPPSPESGGDAEYTTGVFTAAGVILQRRSTSMEPREAVAYRYDPATRALTRGAALTTPDGRGVGASLMVDLDRDGRLDALTARPHFEVLWGTDEGFEAPRSLDGAPGDPMRYEPSWASLNVDDLDDDGWLDVIVGASTCCTTCREMKLFLRTGPRAFADRSDLLGDAPASTGVAVMSTALGADRALVAMGDPCGGQDAPGFYRRASRDAQGYPRYAPFDPIPADAYVRIMSPKPERRRPITLWSPMGAAVADLDGDGRDDLGVSLNFYVGRFQVREATPFADRTTANGPPTLVAAAGRPMIPWGLAYLDLDQDGRPDEVVAHGNDHSAMVDPAYAVGPQRVRALWNAGNFRWVDVTAALRLDRLGQWRSLTLGDLEGDGDADLIVGGLGEMPRVYRNDAVTGRHGFSLRLRGATSNTLGVGARVEVYVREGDPPRRYVAGGTASPFAASEPLVFVGLGEATRAARVRVTWPSGLAQDVADLAAGVLHTVVEPALLAVEPPSRHLSAAARDDATVRVTPRNPDGSVRRGAAVTATVTAGAARIEQPPMWDGAAFVVRLRAPSAPGSSVVEVRVDGVPSGVRPRIWWD